MQAMRILVFGKVQGVMFRDFARRKAVKLGIKGFVQNKKDGSVYIVACGDKESMDSFLNLVKKGSLFSRVEEVKSDTLGKQECVYKDFIIKY